MNTVLINSKEYLQGYSDGVSSTKGLVFEIVNSVLSREILECKSKYDWYSRGILQAIYKELNGKEYEYPEDNS